MRCSDRCSELTAANPYEAEISRAVEWVAVSRVMGLAGGAAMPQVRAVALKKLENQRGALEGMMASADDSDAAHYFLLSGNHRTVPGGSLRLRRLFRLRRAAPPGAPIGNGRRTTWKDRIGSRDGLRGRRQPMVGGVRPAVVLVSRRVRQSLWTPAR